MPAKQKVTLYISDDLHRQFKIRSAIDGETMSSMAQRAMEFYLGHAELVEATGESHGQAHRIHSCPQCASSIALRDGNLTLIRDYAERQFDSLAKLECISDQRIQEKCISEQCISDGISDKLIPDIRADSKSPEEGELITC